MCMWVAGVIASFQHWMNESVERLEKGINILVPRGLSQKKNREKIRQVWAVDENGRNSAS